MAWSDIVGKIKFWGAGLDGEPSSDARRILKNAVTVSPHTDLDRVDLIHGCRFDAMLTATIGAGMPCATGLVVLLFQSRAGI
jgi:hypothetical protein